MSEKMSNYHAAEFANGMRKKIESGAASNYEEADKLQERENYLNNLENAKKEIESRNYLNLPFYLKEAGETKLVSRFYNEIYAKIGIEKIEKCLALLGEHSEPVEKNIKEFEEIFGHEIYKLSIGCGERSPRTPFYLLISKFTAEISILHEDFRDLDYLKFINDEDRFKEIEKLAEVDDKNRSQLSRDDQFLYDQEKLKRARSMERIEMYRNIIKKFLKDVEDMDENKTNPKEVLAEIEKEIDKKLLQAK